MKKGGRVLIVDDEPNIRRILQAAFEKQGLEARIAESAEAALARLPSEPVDCVLTDVTMPGMNGYEFHRKLRETHPDMPVVIMTAYGTIPQAVQAIRDGAYEYVTKPFDLNSLIKVVRSAITHDAPRKPRKRAGAAEPVGVIAESPAMAEVLRVAERAADSRATVLLTGESGVGKEVIAKFIHARSPRSGEKFVAVSCAALPETLLESELFGYEKGAFTGAQASKLGRFELANKGTLFLDEIGEVPQTIQVKLLRVLQEREFERLGAVEPTKVDVRLLAATNKDLPTEVDAGRFRLDLLYRLQVVELTIPPLRERREDIEPLTRSFLLKFSQENGRAVREVDPKALEALLRYAWPGNVRELENAVERAVVLASPEQQALTVELLPKVVAGTR